MKQKSLLFIFFILISFTSQKSYSQHIKIDKKALSFLSNTEQINVVFTYDDLIIDKDVTEVEFLKKMNIKIIRLSNEEQAIDWAESYNEHKNEIWGNAFLSILNERIANFKHTPFFKTNIKNAQYTMKVQAKWMYYGYDAGITDMPSKLTLYLTFFKTNEPDTIIFSTKISRAEGTYNRENGDGDGVGPSLNRMRKAYIKAGFKLSQSLKRVLN